MKNQYINAIIFLIVFCLIIPFTAMQNNNKKEQTPENTEIAEKFIVLEEETGKTEKLLKKDYLTGVLFAEISPKAQTEAIKAQCVAAYTFACYKKANSTEKYDITDNYEKGQGYMSEKAAKEKFGDKYEEYRQIFLNAIEATDKYVITYDGKIINAMYHAVSGGKTESYENVFSQSVPYLIPVESVGDLLSPKYLSTVSMSETDFIEKIKSEGKTIDGELIGKSEKSESGTVLNINIGANNFKGSEIRKIFSLNSANFDITSAGGNIVFTVRGSGHGVGMSQCGAEYMASLGSTFIEILSWYYPGCEMIVN